MKVINWLKSEKKRMLKEIRKVEKHFDTSNPVVKEGFDLWKQSMEIMTHNKFLEQLKIDYEIDLK